jgi:peroxiredoxin
MKENLRPRETFPDSELSSHEDEVVKLSSIIRGFPTAVVFSRGYFCPKDRRQLLNYVTYLQPELIVNYCKLVIVSVDNPIISKKVRDGIGATFPFLCDSDRKIIRDLDIVDTTDTATGRSPSGIALSDSMGSTQSMKIRPEPTTASTAPTQAPSPSPRCRSGISSVDRSQFTSALPFPGQLRSHDRSGASAFLGGAVESSGK